MTADSPVIVALDVPSTHEALKAAELLEPAQCRLKVGKELFTRSGPEVVNKLHAAGFEVFLDLKFHDIPNTTAQAVLAAADMGVWMLNVHAACGAKAMERSKELLLKANLPTKLIAVTVLTSFDAHEFDKLGYKASINEQVMLFAELAHKSGLDGVVCSAHEASALTQKFGAEFLKVTPGIRMKGDSAQDQSRVCTPDQALKLGATHLVMGRSILGASSPKEALAQALALTKA